MAGDSFKHVYDKAAMARSVARMLLEIDAVLFRADEPFKLTSGMMSPVYIDCRKIISFPADAVGHDGLWRNGDFK